MTTDERVIRGIEAAFAELFNTTLPENNIQLQETRKDFEGTHTFVCFPYQRYSKMKPEETGKAIGEYLVEKLEDVKEFNVVKGFLNLTLQDKIWLEAMRNHSFDFNEPKGEIMVEFSSPNTNKPLHLGHLRNIFLGWSVTKIYEYTGYKVRKVQIVNDRGIHICKSMVAWKYFGKGNTPQDVGMKGDQFVGDFYVKFDLEFKKQVAEWVERGEEKEYAEVNAPVMKEAKEMLLKWEAGDQEVVDLWKKMNGWVYKGFDKTYEKIGVGFDKLYFESDTYKLGKDVVLKGLEKGVFFRKDDGSVWVDLSDEGLDEKLLLRSDGTSVYMTQDIGTAILRYEDYPNISRQVYTVGNEQEYHFKVLFLILKKLGYSWAGECYHLSYGMVDLPTGKMKSREGTVVDADNLVDDVISRARAKTKELGKIDKLTKGESDNLYNTLGLGALKYYLLKVDAKKRMLFNPEESVDLQGDTGPFIQYTHARINSLLEKARDMNISAELPGNDIEVNDIEVGLISRLLNFKGTIEQAAAEYAPSLIAAYIYDLAKDYNKLWQNVIILKEDDPVLRSFRVYLSGKVAEAIKRGLALLGIGAPNRM